MNLKENLKRIRKENNLSQEELAEKLNVSRQSISKWESGLTYPEMDKMLEICKIFNVNINDLLNGNVNESNNTNQVKNNINKFIESLLSFITKTVDMFSSMTFKNKIRCLLEQWLIFLILFILLRVIGSIFYNISSDILNLLPFNISRYIYYVFKALYSIFSIILEVVLMIHIFKTRYLDYYDNSKKEGKEKTGTEAKENKEEKYVPQKEAKIIIRDPKHSEYGFINGLMKIILFIFKLFLFFVFIGFCFSLIFLSTCLIMGFLFVKSGTLFVGYILIVLSCMAINYIIAETLYNFIYSHKSNAKLLAKLFFLSLVVVGIGVGLILISIPQFDRVSYDDKEYYSKFIENIEMTDNAYFLNTNINYISNSNNDILVEYIYMNHNEISRESVDDGYYIHLETKDGEIQLIIRDIIKAINNKKVFIDNDELVINIYSNESNIEKMKENLKKHYENR